MAFSIDKTNFASFSQIVVSDRPDSLSILIEFMRPTRVALFSPIEITKKYWQELLDGQSAGLIIVENEKGYPVLKEYKQTLLELHV